MYPVEEISGTAGSVLKVRVELGTGGPRENFWTKRQNRRSSLYSPSFFAREKLVSGRGGKSLSVLLRMRDYNILYDLVRRPTDLARAL